MLLSIYANKDKNEFAIGLKEDENFRAITKKVNFILDLLMHLIR